MEKFGCSEINSLSFSLLSMQKWIWNKFYAKPKLSASEIIKEVTAISLLSVSANKTPLEMWIQPVLSLENYSECNHQERKRTGGVNKKI